MTNITDEMDRPSLDRPDIKNRTKRAWFPFMGSVGKPLFGVATQDDINQIIQHIRKFETLKASITTDTSEIMQTMHSLYSALDKRQNILKAMTDNLRNGFDSLTTDMRVKLVTLIGMGALQYATLLAFQTQLLKEQAGINRLYAVTCLRNLCHRPWYERS
jgi:hypothetical protein